MDGSSPGAEIRKNLASVRERIAKAQTRDQSRSRSQSEVTLVAVSKLQTDEVVAAGIAAGVTDLGENYVQELERKLKHFGDASANLRWHLIGPLQSNKAKLVVGRVDLIHTVDRLSLAKTIDRWAAAEGIRQKILVQINVAGEKTKSGVAPLEIDNLVNEILMLRNLELAGLMAMPPFSDNPEDSRPYFRKMRDLLDRLNSNMCRAQPLRFLSMGTSQDFEVAIEEGATHVRVGTTIFGKRGIQK